MAGHRLKHNTRLIRKDYTYTVAQVAEMFQANPQTVLRWVDDGLVVIPQTRPYLIHSSDLHDYLSTRQAKQKHPCTDAQIFCLKCRLPRGVQQGTLTTQNTRNNFLRLCGRCDTCGCKTNKVIKPEKWGQNHPLYVCIKPSVEQHSGTLSPQPECQSQQGDQLWLDLTP